MQSGFTIRLRLEECISTWCEIHSVPKKMVKKREIPVPIIVVLLETNILLWFTIFLFSVIPLLSTNKLLNNCYSMFFEILAGWSWGPIYLFEHLGCTSPQQLKIGNPGKFNSSPHRFCLQTQESHVYSRKLPVSQHHKQPLRRDWCYASALGFVAVAMWKATRFCCSIRWVTFPEKKNIT